LPKTGEGDGVGGTLNASLTGKREQENHTTERNIFRFWELGVRGVGPKREVKI